MTVHNVGEQIKQDLENVLQVRFEDFCLEKLADLKLRYSERTEELSTLQLEVDKLEKELQLFNTENYKDAYYKTNNSVYYDNRDSKYHQDLRKLSGKNKK